MTRGPVATRRGPVALRVARRVPGARVLGPIAGARAPGRLVGAPGAGRVGGWGLVLALVTMLGSVTPATAATWSAPNAYDAAPASCLRESAGMECVSEPAPRVAVNGHGAAVAAWIDLHRRVRVAVATRPGRFGRAATLAGNGLRPAAAITPDGAVTVAWAGRAGTIAYRQRAAGSAAFGRTRTLAPRGAGRIGDDAVRLAAQADGTVVAAYESGVNVRTVTIAADGRPGPLRTLGPGRFDDDTARAAPDGTLALCCISPVNDDPSVPIDTASKVALFRPLVGWQLVSAGAVGDDAIESVFATSRDLVLGTTDVKQSGDLGVLGVPSLARASADGTIGPPLRAPVERRDRGLAPSAAVDGSGLGVLVYQEKVRAQAFSRQAPVWASGTPAGAPGLARRQRLFGGQGYEPTARPLGPGAIAVWQQPHDRWGVAIERGATFHRVSSPRGPGPSGVGEDASQAYDLATSGPYAVLTWTARNGAVRVSERG